jgi:ATP-dependent DNA helicase PIF1
MFQGVTTGKFFERQLPVPINIELKVGAQVMLAKNSKGTKDFVNGDIGTITEISTDRVKVMIERSLSVVEVPIAQWEQFDYKFNEETKKIERDVVGTYSQLPVILGWAITIHRSQGLTLEKVHIDLGQGAFESGQTYVALSRCRSLSTLSLARPVRAGDIKVDPEATAFYEAVRP